MNRKIMLILALTLIFTVSAIAGGFTMIGNAEGAPAPQKTISVSSEGSVKVKPDTAIINIGVQTENASSKVAQQDNAAKMEKVMKLLKDNKLAEADIKTSQYTIYPIESYSEKDQRSYITGYRVINSLEVTIRDIAKVGAILDAVASNGANTVSNIRFTVSDPEKYYLQALENASSKAKAKAEVLAKQFGIKIGLPSQINESGGGYNPPILYSKMDSAMAASEVAPTTAIASGELEIRASVSLVYNY